MQNLNKENFFNEMTEKYPNAMAAFCKFIDAYKLEVGWDGLFNREDYTEVAPIKFHDIPLEMQLGIISRFFTHFNYTNEEWPNILQEMKDSLGEDFAEYEAGYTEGREFARQLLK